MNRDPILVEMVARQADLFNRNAPEWERIVVFQQIEKYQKEKRRQE
jgi:hypothetical protein